ncbi:MAG: hypothetical protein J7L86_03720 [Candidatus Marinimicrobia bacterium]|nr:hypothetical protein [Candidatus Neomarinimicrobiota bacterium]
MKNSINGNVKSLVDNVHYPEPVVKVPEALRQVKVIPQSYVLRAAVLSGNEESLHSLQKIQRRFFPADANSIMTYLLLFTKIQNRKQYKLYKSGVSFY